MPDGDSSFSVSSSVSFSRDTEFSVLVMSELAIGLFMSISANRAVFFIIIPEKGTKLFTPERVFLNCSTAPAGGNLVIIFSNCLDEKYSGKPR